METNETVGNHDNANIITSTHRTGLTEPMAVIISKQIINAPNSVLPVKSVKPVESSAHKDRLETICRDSADSIELVSYSNTKDELSQTKSNFVSDANDEACFHVDDEHKDDDDNPPNSYQFVREQIKFLNSCSDNGTWFEFKNRKFCLRKKFLFSTKSYPKI